jgi:hypothetical protein
VNRGDQYVGPRQIVTARLSTDAVLKLELVASAQGMTRTAFLVRFLERSADQLFDATFGGLGEALAEEKARRG